MDLIWLLLTSLFATACTAQAGHRRSLFRYRETIPPVMSPATDSTLLMPADLNVGASQIVVVDDATPDVRVIDLSGTLIRSIGRKGEGPGEFQDISGAGMSVTGTLAVADRHNRRVSIFDADGALAEEWDPGRGGIGALCFDDLGRIHLARLGAVQNKTIPGTGTVTVFSTDGRLEGNYGTYEHSEDPRGDAYLNEVRCAPSAGGRVWLLYPYRGYVQEIARNGRVVRQITLPPPVGREPDGPFTAQDASNPMVYAVIRMPVADDIAVDSTGTIYVAVLQTPSGRAPFSEVFALEPDGPLNGAQKLGRPARRIGIHGKSLYALVDIYQHGDPEIDVYDLKR